MNEIFLAHTRGLCLFLVAWLWRFILCTNIFNKGLGTYVLLDYTCIYLQTSIFFVSGILVLRVHCTFHPLLFVQLSSVWSLVYLWVLHLLNPIAIHHSLDMGIQVSNTMLAYDFCIQGVFFSSLNIGTIQFVGNIWCAHASLALNLHKCNELGFVEVKVTQNEQTQSVEGIIWFNQFL